MNFAISVINGDDAIVRQRIKRYRESDGDDAA